ncbi:Rossmann-like and DUF2520 domain-containing protein [Spongiivirga citrea]|uniref:DUF2520 domain-containing protein n=1 Tax=Spongiivirga citrea TaxID=1481457 RepID=A0A6M0CD21_9FLAO|nr:DUF2520 domain-containing protein [Spongiivirga citrea]NER15591.1 DUF2520 domain-containing protein [Spongiivirga citrea]
MIRVVLIGYGNVGFHLYHAIKPLNDVEIVQIYNRKSSFPKNLPKTTPIANSFDKLEDADVYIMTVSDDAIISVSQKIQLKSKLVVHTSGNTSMHAIDKKHRRGVFYPLQTFSIQRQINFSEVPICIETENKEDEQLLQQLAEHLGCTTHKLSTDQRRSLHLAAVFVNNFTNHLYRIGHELCESNRVPFDILKPLIKETASKLDDLTPFMAQTGPAKRGDSKTVNKHLELLENEKQKEVYTTFSQLIANLYGKEL